MAAPVQMTTTMMTVIRIAMAAQRRNNHKTHPRNQKLCSMNTHYEAYEALVVTLATGEARMSATTWYTRGAYDLTRSKCLHSKLQLPLPRPASRVAAVSPQPAMLLLSTLPCTCNQPPCTRVCSDCD